MAKRGRPSIFETLNVPEIEEVLKAYEPGKSQRCYENRFYEATGEVLTRDIISESDSKIPYIEKIYDMGGNIKDTVYPPSVMVEIGRMWLQDNYGTGQIKQVLTIAAQMRHDGHSVKEVAKYIQEIRKTGELPPIPEKVVKTVEITESELKILRRALYGVIRELLYDPDIDYDTKILPLVTFYDKIASPEFTASMNALMALPDE